MPRGRLANRREILLLKLAPSDSRLLAPIGPEAAARYGTAGVAERLERAFREALDGAV